MVLCGHTGLRDTDPGGEAWWVGVEHIGVGATADGSVAGDPGGEPLDGRVVAVCGRCGEVIGVYEPLVLCRDGMTRVTSIAAEPGVASVGGEMYHRACYEPA